MVQSNKKDIFVKSYSRFPHLPIPSFDQEVGLLSIFNEFSYGQRLPIEHLETYLFLKESILEFKNGLYHYRPDINELEYIDSSPDIGFLSEGMDQLHAVIVFTSKFTEKAFVLEAGARVEIFRRNLHKNKQLIPIEIEESVYVNLEKSIDIDGVSEAIIYALSFSK